MAQLNKNSLIVEVCSNIINKKDIKNEDYQEAQRLIKELSSDLNPTNRYEIGQLVGFLVNDKFNQATSQYVDLIADTKRVGLGDKAEFKFQKGNVTALWQAKGSTAVRSAVGTDYKTLETDEISAAPSVELEQLQNGQIDFTSVVNSAAEAMENKFVQQVESVVKAYWDDLASPWYATANGVTSAIDAIITAVGRLGSPVILADIAAAQKFTALTAFNNYVTDANATLFHNTGLIGNYRGARIMQLNNPLTNDTDMTTTLLNKGYIYVVPAGADTSNRPLKVVFEGDVSTYETTHAQSRVLEIAMYKKIGIGFASTRYGMGLFIDSGL